MPRWIAVPLVVLLSTSLTHGRTICDFDAGQNDNTLRALTECERKDGNKRLHCYSEVETEYIEDLYVRFSCCSEDIPIPTFSGREKCYADGEALYNYYRAHPDSDSADEISSALLDIERRLRSHGWWEEGGGPRFP